VPKQSYVYVSVVALSLAVFFWLRFARLIDFPYSESPDTFQHLGTAHRVLIEGRIPASTEFEYLSFPVFFVSADQLSLLTSGDLLMAGSMLTFFFTFLYVMVLYLIFLEVSGNSKLAFFSVLFGMVTNAQFTDIFPTPYHYSLVVMLTLHLLLLKTLTHGPIIRTRKHIAVTTMLLASLTLGDPAYTVSFAISAVALMVLVRIKQHSRVKTTRIIAEICVISLTFAAGYYIYSNARTWLIPSFYQATRSFPSLVLSNVHRAFLRAKGQGITGLLGYWLQIAYVTSRIVYVFVGSLGIIIIVRALFSRNNAVTNRPIGYSLFVLATSIPSALGFGIGSDLAAPGSTSAFARFGEYTYLYLFFLVAYTLCLKPRKLPISIFKPRLILPVTVTLLVLLATIYAPLHLPLPLSEGQVGRDAVYAAQFLVSHYSAGQSIAYDESFLLVVQFYSARSWREFMPGVTFLRFSPQYPWQSSLESKLNDIVNIIYANEASHLEFRYEIG